ncbi:MAG: DNA translocase FtsK 4TM domain-containing protein [Lachnospiraceae bacterium]|nr:DNA translocase FtsK 4TM domain-containing protein [Lachnospiraceae bacterium]
MAHKGTSSAVRNASRKPTQKSKSKTTKKPGANATSSRRRQSSSASSAGGSRSRSAGAKTTASGSAKQRSAQSSARQTAARQAAVRSAPVRSAPVREPMNPEVKTDIMLMGMMLFCVLLIMSNAGIGGSVGTIFSSFFFGLFGIMEFVFPFCLFVLVAFLVANKGHRRRTGMLTCYFLFFVFVCAFMHMITEGYHPEASILDIYSTSSFDRSGGGLFGGLIVFTVGKAFGKWGCIVVSLFGMIISLCVATQRPLVSAAAKGGLHARDWLTSLREKTLQKKELLPFDEEEFGLTEEEERDLLYPKQEKKEKKGTRRSGIIGPSVPKPERKARQRSVPEPSREPAFSSSFLYSLDSVTGEQQSLSVSETEIPSSMNTQDLYDLFDPEEEMARPVPSWEDSEPVLTINKSEGAAAMEMEQMVQTEGYNPYEETAAPEAESQDEKKRKKKNPRSSEDEIASGIETISDEIQEKAKEVREKPYQLPSLDLLKPGTGIPRGDSQKNLRETAMTLEQVLRDFGVNVQVVDASCGPSVTRYELKPEQGVKVSKIVNLADDIKLNLAASNIRIEAPIPGKAAVGIEVPNKTVAPVLLRDLLESPEFRNHPSRIAFAVGKDIAGKTVVTDIARMPHLLIAGATGSGKSVCINTLIMSILYKASPDEVKLLMIDPKVVELSVYNGIPHLAIPVVTDPKKAAGALNWAVAEMSDRYNKFAEYGVRDVAGYNARVEEVKKDKSVPEDQIPAKMPQIVIVVDELADLMMVAPGEVEDAICRLAQLARAAGIHLIIATQRPSVNVVTGLIKANMPSRIALSVASGVDSRTILDMNGAEKLLGHGDMLFYPQGYTQPARVQGGYISDEEIAKVVSYLTSNHGEVEYDASIVEKINSSSSAGGAARGSGSDQDELFIDAAKLIIDKDKASIGMLQRQFKIGFNRAARIMDQLCESGVVGAEEGTKPRKVLMSREQFENYLEEGRL